MKFILTLVFSVFDTFPIIFLSLILFRFRINKKKILYAIIIGIILSLISMILQSFNLKFISMPVQALVLYVLFSGFLKVNLLESFVKTTPAYFLYAFIQALLMFIVSYFNLISVKEAMIPYSLQGYIIQFFSFVLSMIVSFVIYKTNEGYSFDIDINVKKVSNSKLFTFLSLLFLIFFGSFYFYFESDIAYGFTLIFVIVSICAVVNLVLNFLRDKEESS